jgi:pentapeptide MXKDX repeat protein
MKHWTHAALTILAFSTVGYAAPPRGGDQMANAMDKPTPKTYEGCVAAGPTAGTFVLTHAAEPAMAKEAMAKDSMSKDTPANGAMGKDAMAATKTLALEGKAVDFSKHVGHQVSVTGTGVPAMAMAHPDAMAPMANSDAMAKKDPPAQKFSVTAFKMIATSCTKM